MPGDQDGTGGPSGTAQFSLPSAVAVDTSGNLYVADFGNNRIRKIDANGNVTTLAGNGIAGFADGTGGPNGTAELDGPIGIAVDAAGNVYVGDELNNRIRKVDLSGNVSTVAGNGQPGDIDGAGGPSGEAEFWSPEGGAVDGAGNVYVADGQGFRLRRIDASGDVTTLLQDGTWGSGNYQRFSAIADVAVDSTGRLYVAAGAIWQVQVGDIEVLSGGGEIGWADGTGGPSGTAEFVNPSALVVAPSGVIYVADGIGNRIRAVAPASGDVTTLAGNGLQGYADGRGGANGTAEFYYVTGVATDADGNVYVADGLNNRIRKITLVTL